MAHLTPDEVVALAQRRVAERRAPERPVPPAQRKPWQYVFYGLLITLLSTLMAWPGIPLEGKLYAAVHGVCAQIHNVTVGGKQLPLCARNTGIYSSALLSVLTLFAIGHGRAARLPPRPILAALLLLAGFMVVDGFNSLFVDLGWRHAYTPQNWLRTLTGIGAGIALGVLLVFMFNQALRKDPERAQPVIQHWHELLGLGIVNLGVWGAVYGNVALAYWPVALVSWSGIVGTVFVILLLPVAVLMGYRRRVERLATLARPATVALLGTAAILAALGALRFASEGWQLLF
jgi:uncharacterized membrane protein